MILRLVDEPDVDDMTFVSWYALAHTALRLRVKRKPVRITKFVRTDGAGKNEK